MQNSFDVRFKVKNKSALLNVGITFLVLLIVIITLGSLDSFRSLLNVAFTIMMLSYLVKNLKDRKVSYLFLVCSVEVNDSDFKLNFKSQDGTYTQDYSSKISDIKKFEVNNCCVSLSFDGLTSIEFVVNREDEEYWKNLSTIVK